MCPSGNQKRVREFWGPFPRSSLFDNVREKDECQDAGKPAHLIPRWRRHLQCATPRGACIGPRGGHSTARLRSRQRVNGETKRDVDAKAKNERRPAGGHPPPTTSSTDTGPTFSLTSQRPLLAPIVRTRVGQCSNADFGNYQMLKLECKFSAAWILALTFLLVPFFFFFFHLVPKVRRHLAHRLSWSPRIHSHSPSPNMLDRGDKDGWTWTIQLAGWRSSLTLPPSAPARPGLGLLIFTSALPDVALRLVPGRIGPRICLVGVGAGEDVQADSAFCWPRARRARGARPAW